MDVLPKQKQDMWIEIKCKKCKAQDKPLFMIQPAQSGDDCYCKECMEAVRQERATTSNSA